MNRGYGIDKPVGTDAALGLIGDFQTQILARRNFDRLHQKRVTGQSPQGRSRGGNDAGQSDTIHIAELQPVLGKKRTKKSRVFIRRPVSLGADTPAKQKRFAVIDAERDIAVAGIYH